MTKDDPITVNPQEISKSLEGVGQELRTKAKYIWEIHFGHLNDQIHISYESQYCNDTAIISYKSQYCNNASEKEGHNLPDKVDRKEQELFVRLQKRQRKKKSKHFNNYFRKS